MYVMVSIQSEFFQCIHFNDLNDHQNDSTKSMTLKDTLENVKC